MLDCSLRNSCGQRLHSSFGSCPSGIILNEPVLQDHYTASHPSNKVSLRFCSPLNEGSWRETILCARWSFLRFFARRSCLAWSSQILGAPVPAFCNYRFGAVVFRHDSLAAQAKPRYAATHHVVDCDSRSRLLGSFVPALVAKPTRTRCNSRRPSLRNCITEGENRKQTSDTSRQQ